jgi:F-type H+-transporting ATPase subunit a
MTAISWQDAAAEAATHAAEGDAFDLGGMIMHHLEDAPYWELPFLGEVHFPVWEPIHVAGITVDLSPSKHVALVIIAGLLCFGLFSLFARRVQRTPAGRAPTGAANAAEALVVYFRDEVVRRNIGHGSDAYTPYILTLFFFILFMNLLGLIPWGGSATGNVSVTAALAIVTFLVVEFSGFRALGAAGYAKTIFFVPPGMGPVGSSLMLVIMAPVEFLGKLTKPFALAIRLFANMTAGHTLILALLGLIFVFGDLTLGRYPITAASLAMASAIMVLELFVAFLQAYIFAMLSSVFIGLIRHAH